jgi:hypothetical protein
LGPEQPLGCRVGGKVIAVASPFEARASCWWGTPLAELGVAVARELTKLHEEVLRGTLSEVLAELRGRAALKGEFVVVIDTRSVPS